MLSLSVPNWHRQTGRSESYHTLDRLSSQMRTRREHGLHPAVISWVEDVVQFAFNYNLTDLQR
jgi:dTDP-4-amino-4,6-dideoxygalactose transaminase